jgi:hypothetical protein
VGEGAGVAITDLNGDGKLDIVSSGVTVLLNIRPPVSSTLLTSSAVPSYLNEPVTFTATVGGQGATPTGSVVFQISLNKPVTVPLVNGTATYSWTFAKAGARTVTARYLGDSTHAPSSSNVVAQPVNALSMTTTNLNASLNPSMVGQPVTYTATVSSQSGVVATGNITFAISMHKSVVVPLVNGTATYAIAYQLAGPRTVTASYAGDAGHLASTSTMLNQTIAQQATTTALSSSLNPSVVGQAVTYTATVTGQNGVTPSGSVTFNVNLNKPAVIALVNGTASYTITFKLAGPRTVTASYSGDGNSAASTSLTITQSITPQATSTTLTSSMNPSAVGQMVTFTATVTGANGVVPMGTVTFAISLNQPAVVNLVNGQATYNWTFAKSGPRTVTASYSGDANNQASTSTVLNQTIQ